jgi:hypothetical protein
VKVGKGGKDVRRGGRGERKKMARKRMLFERIFDE